MPPPPPGKVPARIIATEGRKPRTPRAEGENEESIMVGSCAGEWFGMLCLHSNFWNERSVLEGKKSVKRR
jgi:hypothetical protein